MPFFFSVSRRPTDPNFGHFPKKKKINDVFKPFFCRTGVSVVDPFFPRCLNFATTSANFSAILILVSRLVVFLAPQL